MIEQAMAMPPDRFQEMVRELNGCEIGERVIVTNFTPFRNRIGLNIGTITILHDITATKKTDQIKSDFVSLVSHEIRSPMNSILMQIKVILDGLAGEITEKQQEILQHVIFTAPDLGFPSLIISLKPTMEISG